MKKTIYHLSHIDLDGYGCQLVMAQTPHSLISYNANYGAEVKDRLEEILESIKKAKSTATILITDLNLYMDEARWLDKEVRELNEKGWDITITLLDHHGSGKDVAESFKWYYLDTTRCATKITYDYALTHFELENHDWLEPFVNVVNSVDLWLQDDAENFEYGKVCMRLVTETRELNRVMFSDDDRDYKLKLLYEAAQMVGVDNANIILDDNIHAMKKNYFLQEQNDTLDNLSVAQIVRLLGNKKGECTIYYRGYKGFLTYSLGNSSILGNGFLTTYPEYDFYIDVGSRGTMSLRGHNRVSVSQIASEIAGGGGHPNAAGGRINGFKEQFRFDKVKEILEDIFANAESLPSPIETKV